MTPAPTLAALDPFDLPEWLGTGAVTWTASGGVRDAWQVPGALRGEGPGASAEMACHLLAVDHAHPAPVAPEEARVGAHGAWLRGEVLVGGDDAGAVVLVVPGSSFTADRVLDAVARLARAVGADPARWAVHLRIGG